MICPYAFGGISICQPNKARDVSTPLGQQSRCAPSGNNIAFILQFLLFSEMNQAFFVFYAMEVNILYILLSKLI